MAEGKKTFIFYSDWINMIREMDNEDAGQLLKHILSYVNDENPETDNKFVRMAFGHMKPMIKKDLVKWEKQIEKFSEMGKESARKRKENATQVEHRLTQVEPTSTVNDNVNVNVTVNDNLNANKEKKGVFNFRKKMIDYGFEKNLVIDWLKVRKTKKASNTQTAFDGFIREVEKRNEIPNDILRNCVEKSWSGFKKSWMDKEKQSDTWMTPVEKFKLKNNVR